METWMVRAEGGELVADFVEKGYVSVGFGADKLGDLSSCTTRDEIARRLREALPGRKEGKIVNEAGQLFRFHREIAKGHEVVCYDPARRLYFVGTVSGDVEHVRPVDEADHAYRRKVKWNKRVLRDALKVSTRNTLGSTLTVFLLNAEAAADIRHHGTDLDAPKETASVPPPLTESENEAGLTVLFDDVVAKSQEFIEDRLPNLDPEDLPRLFAGILRAMGYKTRVSKKGPDRGVDIFASPDGLGLQEPRVFVEVKCRSASMGAPELRSFLGGRKPQDRCLYVSTGGFTKEAYYEAERSPIPLTLVDLPALRELLVEHYAQLDNEARALVPLTPIYWPAPTDR